MKLLEPLDLGRRQAPNRILFGPHETNLGQGRAISERHAAYYRARAEGGCGVVVIEQASVHPSDWPYERCPLAAEAGPGWAITVDACRGTDALLLAALGHSGGQGSSAYSQRELWAPSDEPEVDTREVPKIMELDDIEAVVAGFERSAAAAVASGLDGVEVNAGQHSLVRQFLSGLTNRRDDEYGQDRLRFARDALEATRRGLGPDAVLGLRLSCDELAPWAGITPEQAGPIAAELARLVDYLVVVRGSIFSVAETRPTGHHGEGFNLELTAGVRASVDGTVPVVAQGSIVDPTQAEAAVAEGRCDAVELTRAQIADPELVHKLRTGRPPRPCVLCNQRCRVRDNRNPIVGCIVEPRAGTETSGPAPARAAGGGSPPVLVVGGGPAGLEAARVAAEGGCAVTLVEASDRLGGLLRTTARAPGHARFESLADHLAAGVTDVGVTVQLGVVAERALLDDWDGPIVLATGGRMREAAVPSDETVRVVTPQAVLDADPEALEAVVPGHAAIWDPIGNNVGIAVAELLAHRGRSVTFITPDAIAGTLLALTGDLPGANVRLQQAGVAFQRRQRLVAIGGGSASLRHVYTAAATEIAVASIVDCSARIPNDGLWTALTDPHHQRVHRAGDAIAPRTVAEAIREGRAAAEAILAGPAVADPGASPPGPAAVATR